MTNPSVRFLIAILKSIPPFTRRRQARENDLMRENRGTDYPIEALLQQKPRYKGDWFRLETKWMGGEMD